MNKYSYPFGEYLCPYCSQRVVLTEPDCWVEFVPEEINCPNCNETGLFIFEEFGDWDGYMFVKRDWNRLKPRIRE